MALTQTQSWDDVERALRDEERQPGRAARVRVSAIRDLIKLIRAERFPYIAFPEFQPPALHLYPSEIYDFDLGFGRSLSFEVHVGDISGEHVDPFVMVEVRHVAANPRLGAYETRSWSMPQETVIRLFDTLFDEVSWPRRDGDAR